MIVLSSIQFKTYLKYINRQENRRYNDWTAPTAFKRFIKTIHINSFLKLLNSHKHRYNTSTLEYINKLSQIDKLVILIIEFYAVCCYFYSKKNSSIYATMPIILKLNLKVAHSWVEKNSDGIVLKQHSIIPLMKWVTN